MGIKIRGLQAFRTLCGGGISEDEGDGLDSFGADKPKQRTNAAVLDKYTIQEKVVPLLKAIKTKEPAVMVRFGFGSALFYLLTFPDGFT